MSLRFIDLIFFVILINSEDSIQQNSNHYGSEGSKDSKSLTKSFISNTFRVNKNRNKPYSWNSNPSSKVVQSENSGQNSEIPNPSKVVKTVSIDSENSSKVSESFDPTTKSLELSLDEEDHKGDFLLQVSQLPNQNDFNLPNCGITRKKGGQIVGGEKAAIGQFPWMISFQKSKSNGRLGHFCGGAVLNQRWIISAAHCFQGVSYSLNKLKAMVGMVQWKSPQAFKYGIDTIISHQQFDPDTYANDICLVKTSEPIVMKQTKTYYIVNGVCVPSKDTQSTDKATVYGWGFLSEEGQVSDDLMKVTVSKFDTIMCNAVYSDFIGSLTPQMMCYASPGKDTCKGDSGGPLTQVINRRTVLTGIVSFGHGCARTSTPGVYQDVAKYYDWIDKTIRDNSKDIKTKTTTITIPTTKDDF